MSPADRLLQLIQGRSAQEPARCIDLRGQFMPSEFDDALEHLVDSRQAAICRRIKAGEEWTDIWPTGLAAAALTWTGPRPRQRPSQTQTNTLAKDTPMARPLRTDTITAKLVRAVEQHGPVCANDLADLTGAPVKNIDGSLAGAIKNALIVTRQIYHAERGKTLKHYMTQAQSMEPSQSPDEQGIEAADRQKLEDDAMAMKRLLDRLAETLRVEDHRELPAALDELLQALSYRAVLSQKPAGRLALLLIDSADLTEIEDLDAADDEDAQDKAVLAIEQGHAARAVVVRILGEAKRRVEWKEAA